MRTLRDLGFIETKEGSTGNFHYVLLLNPNIAIEKLKRAGNAQTSFYGRFRDRLIDIGAERDITDYDDYLDEIADAEEKAAAKVKAVKAVAPNSEAAKKRSKPKGAEK
jgi:hypothetical protein